MKEKAAAAKAAAEAAKAESDPAENKSESATTEPAAPPSAHPAPNSSSSQSHGQQPRPPPLQIRPTPSIGLMPPGAGVNMGRRVSLANGEAAKIETFLAKQRLAARKAQNGLSPALVSPVRAPVVGQNQANAARCSSIPYPTPIAEGNGSPKISPISPTARATPMTLHLTAIRNNSRRASVPGLPGAQLLSSGPFTPPRVVSGSAAANGPTDRGLSPIKDHDVDYSGQAENYATQDPDLSSDYLTPPHSSYLTNASPSLYSYDPALSGTFDYTGEGQIPPNTPNGPLPNPSFSFGTAPMANQSGDVPPAAFTEMQARGRLGSIASINTYTTEGTTGQDGSEWDWNGMFEPAQGVDGFDPSRRASA
jgi:hypothetical protein